MNDTETRPMVEHDPLGYAARTPLVEAVAALRHEAARHERLANRLDSALSGTGRKETPTQTWDRGYMRGLATAYKIAANLLEAPSALRAMAPADASNLTR